MSRTSIFPYLFVSILAMAWASAVLSDDEHASSNDVHTIFREHCLKCHGGREVNAGLNFLEPESLQIEADSGRKPIVAGNAAASELMIRIRDTEASSRMPPEGERLSPQAIEIVERWIESGAAWPKPDKAQSYIKNRSSDHWSFQPIVNPPSPVVQDPSWAWNPVDRFLQAKHEAQGLIVARDCDLTTLIRRASYALTGLPPSPTEIDDFVTAAKDEGGRKQAIASLVDRLLAQPAYGERWGRHWMDWVRYADTAGDNSDYPIPQAYLYRNYLIDSFNDDLPYDQFLTEQIAGDLLPYQSQADRNRQTIATGYLAMARRFGSLIERYPWNLTIEDTIDNLGRSIMGITLACARCHDHKFDPITTRDYYGLYGIFASTRYPMPGLELFKAQRHFVSLLSNEETARHMEPHHATIEQLSDELESLLSECQSKVLEDASMAGAISVGEQRSRKEATDKLLLKARKAGEKLADYLKKLPSIPTAYAVQDGTPRDAAIQLKGEFDRLGATVPRRFPEIFSATTPGEPIDETSSGRLQLSRWLTDPRHPLTARVIVNRVWQRHFGKGLVETTSDFGIRGVPPTHPELLDWLAADFMAHGWSIKHLHRRLMTSRAYQLSSIDEGLNRQMDPDNRMLWRFNRMRLDAESIRDTLLLLSGSLNRQPLDEPHPFPPHEEWSFTQHYPFKGDYDSQHRSIYLMVKRLSGKPFFQTFDGADPNVCTAQRDQSVTALQALYFVNDQFLHEQARKMAENVLAVSASQSQRLGSIFKFILGREPQRDEWQVLENHLRLVREKLTSEEDRSTRELQAWSSLIRGMLRMNEFVYLD